MGSQNRKQLGHYLSQTETGLFTQLAKGFSDLSSTLNAQTKEVTYIDDSSDSTITAYARSWEVTGDVFTDNPANELLFRLAYTQAKGDDAVVWLINVIGWQPSENNPETVFKANKQKCSWIPSNDGGGAGGETVTFAGTLAAKGDPVYGWATVTPGATDEEPPTAVFSADEPAAP